MHEYYFSEECFILKLISAILTVLRLALIIIYMRQAQKFIVKLGDKTDRLTIAMFICLGISAIFIIIFRLLRIYIDTRNGQQVQNIDEEWLLIAESTTETSKTLGFVF